MNQLLSKELVKSLSVGVFLICGLLAVPAKAADGITGYWDIKITFGEREMTSKLRIFKNDDGQLAGVWTSGRGQSALSDVKFEQGTLTFTRKSTYRDRQWVSTYEGTLSGDTLTGVLKSERGEIKANGKRGGPDWSGTWELTSTSQRGTRKQFLTIKEDKTATMRFRDDEITVKELKTEGELLSFKVELTFGEQSFTMDFKGKLKGDALEGEFITSRGSRKVTGKKVTGQASNSAQSRQAPTDPSKPARTDVITPIRNETFDRNGTTKQRKQGGNPRKVAGYLAFDGSMDGNRQVDPQIAVGGGYVLHGTNSGIIIYDKQGNFVQGVRQSGFNGGIDPKMFFDRHNQIFGFDLWNPWDKEKKKPVNISVSETSDPLGAWNTYPVPAPGGRDGGGIGYSKKWIGYTFPGGREQTFVLKTAEAKAGKPATVYHFPGNLGQAAATQDDIEDLYFFKLSNSDFIIKRVTDSGDGSPRVVEVATKPHGLEYIGWPPQSPQKGTTQKTASGDRNPKNLVIQNGHIWFSQAVNCNGRAAVQWHQVKLDGSIVQTGLISDSVNSYIQTTIAVNKNYDVLVGFQETGPDMFISPRLAFRLASDPPGELREIVKLGEGQGATNGVAWGDYSGSVVDGDNFTDLWTIQSITDKGGKGDTVIVKVPFKRQ